MRVAADALQRSTPWMPSLAGRGFLGWASHPVLPSPTPLRRTRSRRWKNVKMWLLIVGIALIISIVIAMLACGADFSKCKSS